MSEAKIKAIAPWFGAKRTLGPEIVVALGEHSAYWEPFCGSLSVLLSKEPCSSETVSDLHGDLINLARALKGHDTAADLYGRLARLVFHEQLFTEAANRFKLRGHTEANESPDVDRAEDFMICSWFGRNGVAGTQSYNQGFCVRYTSNGGHAAKRWRSVVESMPAWHERLCGVTILNRDGFALLARIDDAPRTVIYCDPPYVVKGASYVHDFDPADHKRLAEALRRFTKTRVVVSYYDHPLLHDLYGDWTWKRLDVNKALVNQGLRDRGGVVKAPEVLLINEKPTGQRELFGESA